MSEFGLILKRSIADHISYLFHVEQIEEPVFPIWQNHSFRYQKNEANYFLIYFGFYLSSPKPHQNEIYIHIYSLSLSKKTRLLGCAITYGSSVPIVHNRSSRDLKELGSIFF